MSLLWDLQVALLRRDFGRAVDRLLEHYRENGQSFGIKVESVQKTIEIQIQMNDAGSPVHINARHYSLEDDGERFLLHVSEIETPWNWVNSALKAFRQTEHRIPIPPEFAHVFRQILHEL
jgi:hypothetical protein